MIQTPINPYSPPATGTESAGDKLSPAARALIVLSLLHLAILSAPLAYTGYSLVRYRTATSDSLELTVLALQVVAMLFFAGGGVLMVRRKSYPTARRAAMLSCIPFLSPFFIVGIPLGIWILRLLADPEVAAEFSRNTSPESGG